MKKIFWYIGFVFITLSCEKDEEWISIADQVKRAQYYDSEIFSPNNQKIYGQWELLYSYGGIAGSKVLPTSDYVMEFIPFGIYGKIKDDEIMEIGKIRIVKQDNNVTVTDFFAEDKYRTDYFLIQKDIYFKGQDTLIL